jgi:hypothetical protein
VSQLARDTTAIAMTERRRGCTGETHGTVEVRHAARARAARSSIGFVAWIFSLAVECGDEPRARACAAYFAGSDAAPPVTVSVERGLDDRAWWAVVVPIGESTSGVVSESVARSLTVAGWALLDRLLGAPPYRFALVGVEAFDAVGVDDLVDRAASDVDLFERLHGLVVSDDVRQRLSPSIRFEPFAPGYVWRPYLGERTATRDAAS